MAKLTTSQALTRLLTDDDYLLTWMQSGYSREDRSRLKYRLIRGKLSTEKMEEILLRCGWLVVTEKQWQKPA